LLVIAAALLFALPGAIGKFNGSASAAPVLSSGEGDVCGVWVAVGNQSNGKIYSPVGFHNYALARTQDSFYLPLRLFAAGTAYLAPANVPTGSNYVPAPSANPVGDPTLLGVDPGPPYVTGFASAGNYRVFADLRPFSEPDVIPSYLSASIDSEVGEAKITDRIEDHWLTNIDPELRFPFIDSNGVGWNWPYFFGGYPIGLAQAVLGMFGDAEVNDISPVDTVNSLDVLTELAGGGGDMDRNNSDIQEFFVNKASMLGTALDETVARNALNNCGLPILSGSSTITSANMSNIWTDLIYCLTVFDQGYCNDLAVTLGINCSLSATTGCWSLVRDVEINLDGWSEISFDCTKPGEVKITFDPTTWQDWYGDFSPAHQEGRSLDVECIGPANSASASATGSPGTVEIHPVGTSVSMSTIVVTVLDANGKRLDGPTVTFTSNDCNLGTSSTGPFSGQSVSTTTDTDTTSDLSFVAQYGAPGNQLFAGTAEAYLQCNVSSATPGTATVTWVVSGDVENIYSATGLTGTVTVNVVGSPSAIKLDVSPATSTCGNPITATATVTDAAGKPVSDGTQVYFTTTTATGTQGGVEGAQGAATTVNGVATVIMSVDPMDAGTHTVSARTGGNDLTGAAVAVVSTSQTISCTAIAAAIPAVITAPKTGQGPTIVPPNTGDAGLAASSSSSYGLVALAGVVVLALAGVATLRFATRR
jgi:hypothetical protein